MNDLITAAQQALEAMRRAVPTGKITLYEWDKAMAALRAALAQQAEPVEPVACSNTFGCRCPKHFAVEQAEPVEPNRWEGDHDIESPNNACMHKGYCMSLKQAREPMAQQAEPAGTRALIEECLAAFAQELAAWDIDPPLHHVKQAHDKCEAWLAAPPQQAEPVAVGGVDVHGNQTGRHRTRAAPCLEA